MGDIVSFKLARKQKARAAREEQAQENRARFGRTKDAKKLESALETKARKDLDAHKRED